jgi:hypothetical protein
MTGGDLPPSIWLLAGVLLLLDAAVRVWRPLRARATSNLIYLTLAWGPFLVLPHIGPRAAMLLAATAGLASLVNFARMVGLTSYQRFFVPALLMAAACFPLAAARLDGPFSALPVIALLGVMAVGVASTGTEGFLQKLCLSWLSVLVYGYLYGHAVLLVDHAPRWSLGLDGPSRLALVILLAKCADITWVVGRRLLKRERLQLLASPIGGLLGGLLVGALAALPRVPLLLLGLGVGVGLGFGSRAYNLIVADVTGQREHQLKGTMLFGFGLAVAIAYWLAVLLPPALG